ncbi:hypothetical protein DFH08DRAFT_1082559 [Mycena albidolilacea]|uniref:Uncharacterized protein n=1 Tax=Mycena albidolilacea TaxID=1033008 RepID=A0AAD6ZTI1_9AGAR|nr:hypothetical protein DFH08DRAFT_1082559 [Mycena albidolilacea]
MSPATSLSADPTQPSPSLPALPCSDRATRRKSRKSYVAEMHRSPTMSQSNPAVRALDPLRPLSLLLRCYIQPRLPKPATPYNALRPGCLPNTSQPPAPPDTSHSYLARRPGTPRPSPVKSLIPPDPNVASRPPPSRPAVSAASARRLFAACGGALRRPDATSRTLTATTGLPTHSPRLHAWSPFIFPTPAVFSIPPQAQRHNACHGIFWNGFFTVQNLSEPPRCIHNALPWHTRPLRWSIHRLASVCTDVHSRNPIAPWWSKRCMSLGTVPSMRFSRIRFSALPPRILTGDETRTFLRRGHCSLALKRTSPRRRRETAPSWVRRFRPTH